MLRAIGATTQFGPSRLVCVHWRTFPPEAAIKTHTLGKDIAALRADKDIDEVAYQRFLVWQRICGMLRMDKRKCRRCPHVRRLAPPDTHGHQVLTRLDGSCPTPIVDLPTIELLGRNKARIAPAQTPPKQR